MELIGVVSQYHLVIRPFSIIQTHTGLSQGLTDPIKIQKNGHEFTTGTHVMTQPTNYVCSVNAYKVSWTGTYDTHILSDYKHGFINKLNQYPRSYGLKQNNKHARGAHQTHD
uniref:Uncharacterized protein n=1 Tax=Pararge aegeria TaxID=116150 RepID=S4PTC8_9NEOP